MSFPQFSPEAVAGFRPDQLFFYFMHMSPKTFGESRPAGPLYVMVGCTRTKTSGRPKAHTTHPDAPYRAWLKQLSPEQRREHERYGRSGEWDKNSTGGVFTTTDGVRYLEEYTHGGRLLVGPCLEAAARKAHKAVSDELVGTGGPTRALAILWLKAAKGLSIEPVWLK